MQTSTPIEPVNTLTSRHKSPPAVPPPDKMAARMAMGAWMLVGLPALMILVPLERLWFGHLPEPMMWATMAIFCLPLGSALARHDHTLRGNVLFFLQWNAIAGGAVLALMAALRALRLW